MRLFQRKFNESIELEGPVRAGPVVVLTIGGMTATEDFKLRPAAMGGGYKIYADILAENCGFEIDESFVGDSSKKASGFAKIAEELLGGKAIHRSGVRGNDFTLLGVSMQSVQQNIANMILANKWDNYYTNEAMELANQVILPMIADNASANLTVMGWNIRGDRLPVEEARERLNKLTIFAQSNGTSVSRMLENAINYSMQQLGYSAEERTLLANQVTILGTGNVTRVEDLDIKAVHFNGIFMESGTDKVAEMLNDYRTPIDIGEKDIVLSKFASAIIAHVKTHPTLLLPHSATGEPTRFTDESTHHVWQYTKRNLADVPNNDVNAQVAENVLRNMVMRNIDFDMMQMFSRAKPVVNTLQDKSSSYTQAIIDEAVSRKEAIAR